MYYPALIEKDDVGYAVSFRDIPEALTCADTFEEAQIMAADALLTAMDFYFEDNRPVPAPSDLQDDEVLVELPASAWAKVLLLNEMLAQNVSNSELARRLNTRPQDVQRIVNLKHSTKIDTISAAAKRLGKELRIQMV